MSWIPYAGRLPYASLALALVLVGCQPTALHPAAPSPSVSADGLYLPERDLGPLFQAVQLARVFEDSKTFADARPLVPPADIVVAYAEAKDAPGFDLAAFVADHFEAPGAVGEGYQADRSQTMEQHIRALWPVLTRPPDDPARITSLIPLPNSYVVPGGRFREVYYWDSYFTFLGLAESGETDLMRNVLDNFAHLIETVGHVPNGNRTYYLGRSQPPYFAAMVGLYATTADSTQALRYLDALEAEHAFWMEGADALAPGTAHRRVVMLADGTVLNRYWDDVPAPRPESYREDVELAQTLPVGQRAALYRNLRAAAESGWDFSSRWMRDPSDLRTLETVDLVPVDLNSLLVHAERTISRLHALNDDAAEAARWAARATTRSEALRRVAFDDEMGAFFDVRWRTGERVTDRPTMAMAAPLYFEVASAEEGTRTARVLERDFLQPGGFVTTLIPSGQQWDAPNGWPPLQWLGAEGVRRYGRADLADTARARWLAQNRRVYQATGKMTEKYDVVDITRPAGGGEYPNQDGFGWTNGVALTFSAQE